MKASHGNTARFRRSGSGETLRITSNQAGIQNHTGQYLPRAFSGPCLEPEQLPDTPNQPHLGPCLRAKDQYRHRAAYESGVREQ